MPDDNTSYAHKGLKRKRKLSNKEASTSSRPLKNFRSDTLQESESTEFEEPRSTEADPSDQPVRSKDVMDAGSYAVKGTKNDLSAWRITEVKDGEVYYFPKFISENSASEWHESLLKLDTWYHPRLKVYGKEVKQSRSIAAYASDKNLTVKYSGHTVQLHHDYPPLLQEIQKRVEEFLEEKFNHVMLNLYESGQEYIGKHRDTKENKVITSLSLGAERTFIMTPNKNNHGASPHKWTLANGSLLVMRGNTQDNWKHEIPKEARVKDSRISLTFRQLSGP